MPDIQRLLLALVEYEGALTDERQRVGEAHAHLTTSYGALAEAYDGVGAREFKAGWGEVQDAFDTWVEAEPALLDLLGDKIEQLRRLDEGLM